MEVPVPPDAIRFDAFEMRLSTQELYKDGVRVKLGPQAFQILKILAERRGELVTREHLHKALWPADTFVDFDHGLNNAVKRIRDVLGDSAETPQYVETLPRLGYRFIGRLTISSQELPVEAQPPLPTWSPTSWSESPAVPSQFGPENESGSGHRQEKIAFALILAFALCAIAYFGWYHIRDGVSPAPKHAMLAVLPFQNLSGDPSQDYFSDGLTEEMISQLGALSPDQLGVIARTTSMAYKNTSKNVQQIGKELGVDYVLECSVRRDGDQIRISVQLIRAHDQVHVWARSYDRRISHSIQLQVEVAMAVAEQIQIKLSSTYSGRPNRYPLDSEANEAYLRGRYFWNQFTAEGYQKAITYFQQAIDRDPNFAEAYSGLSDSYHFLGLMDSIPPGENEAKSLEAARRAVALGGNLAESHTSLARLSRSEWNWSGMENEFKLAIALNPSYALAHRLYAAMLAAEGRHREALQQINEAMRLDPLSLPNNAEVVRTLYYARNYDQAIVQGQKALQLDPNYARTHFWLGRVYSQKGMYREAIAAAEKILETTPDNTMGLTEMAYSLASAGRQTEAREILRRLEKKSEHTFVPAYNMAVIHIALNEDEAAMRYMQQSYENQDWALIVLAVEPRLDPLRRDPRFQELRAKLKLP